MIYKVMVFDGGRTVEPAVVYAGDLEGQEEAVKTKALAKYKKMFGEGVYVAVEAMEEYLSFSIITHPG